MLQRREAIDRLPHLLLCEAQLVEALQIEPKFCRSSKKMSQAKRCITRNGSPAVQDFGDTVGWYIELPCEFSGAHIEFCQLFGQMFSGVNRTNCHAISPNGSQRSPHLMGQALPQSTQSRWSLIPAPVRLNTRAPCGSHLPLPPVVRGERGCDDPHWPE